VSFDLENNVNVFLSLCILIATAVYQFVKVKLDPAQQEEPPKLLRSRLKQYWTRIPAWDRRGLTVVLVLLCLNLLVQIMSAQEKRVADARAAGSSQALRQILQESESKLSAARIDLSDAKRRIAEIQQAQKEAKETVIASAQRDRPASFRVSSHPKGFQFISEDPSVKVKGVATRVFRRERYTDGDRWLLTYSTTDSLLDEHDNSIQVAIPDSDEKRDANRDVRVNLMIRYRKPIDPHGRTVCIMFRISGMRSYSDGPITPVLERPCELGNHEFAEINSERGIESVYR
jgi:Na+-translocating ferredoxin:NAD+ oxidoreductase RnfG subunit